MLVSQVVSGSVTLGQHIIKINWLTFVIIFCFLYNFIPKNGITFNYVFCKSLLCRGVPSNIYVWVNIIMKYFLSIMCELYWIKSCQSRSIFHLNCFDFILHLDATQKKLKMKRLALLKSYWIMCLWKRDISFFLWHNT